MVYWWLVFIYKAIGVFLQAFNDKRLADCGVDTPLRASIRKEGLGSLERKYLWEDISHLSKSENIQEYLIRWVPVSIYTATEELRPKQKIN